MTFPEVIRAMLRLEPDGLGLLGCWHLHDMARHPVLQGCDSLALPDYALEHAMIPLSRDAMAKVAAGMVSS